MSRNRTRPKPGTFGYVAMLCGAVAGLILVARGNWRDGGLVIGAALVFGAVLRLLLPDRMAGLLRVRRKLVDAAMLVGMAFTMVFMTLSIAARR
ncbi:hypothetical protein BH18ACT8_BH18ACT8_13970 [soil metagenome]